MKNTIRFFLIILLIICPLTDSSSSPKWGFFAHKLINRLAVFTLPPEMLGFYKFHIDFLTENAVNPDKRRYLVEGEAPCHYIDLDAYGDSAWYRLPHRWTEAVAMYSEDTLMAYGVVPWHIYRMKLRLTDAFRDKNVLQILKLSADLGHYIGDANVPLHTTQNYNGQLSGQYGIHGFWESRLPELFSADYDLFTDKAQYIRQPQERAWLAVKNANAALDSVLAFEKKLFEKMGSDKKYNFELRNRQNIKVISKHYAEAYHRLLDGQVERQLRASVQMVGDYWLSAWIDAGQPNLDSLIRKDMSLEDWEELREEKLFKKDSSLQSRPHEH
jgi:hypothetical protein